MRHRKRRGKTKTEYVCGCFYPRVMSPVTLILLNQRQCTAMISERPSYHLENIPRSCSVFPSLHQVSTIRKEINSTESSFLERTESNHKPKWAYTHRKTHTFCAHGPRNTETVFWLVTPVSCDICSGLFHPQRGNK